MFEGVWAEILTLACMHSIVALGLYIQISSGQLNIAQAAFFGTGAYVGGIVTARLGLPFALAIVIAIVFTAGMSALLSRLVLRLSHFFYAVAMLAFGEALVVLFQNISYVGGSLGFRGIPWATTRPIIYVAFLLSVLFVFNLDRSRFMQAVRACGDDPEAAQAVGCDPQRVRVVTAALSGALAGLGGVLYAHYLTVVVPEYLGFAASLNYLLYTAVGGVTTFLGPIVGTFLFTALPELLRFSDQIRFIAFGLLLVAMMVVRPQGLIVRRHLRSTRRWRFGRAATAGTASSGAETTPEESLVDSGTP